MKIVFDTRSQKNREGDIVALSTLEALLDGINGSKCPNEFTFKMLCLWRSYLDQIKAEIIGASMSTHHRKIPVEFTLPFERDWVRMEKPRSRKK